MLPGHPGSGGPDPIRFARCTIHPICHPAVTGSPCGRDAPSAERLRWRRCGEMALASGLRPVDAPCARDRVAARQLLRRDRGTGSRDRKRPCRLPRGGLRRRHLREHRHDSCGRRFARPGGGRPGRAQPGAAHSRPAQSSGSPTGDGQPARPAHPAEPAAPYAAVQQAYPAQNGHATTPAAPATSPAPAAAAARHRQLSAGTTLARWLYRAVHHRQRRPVSDQRLAADGHPARRPGA